ncbi:hypothetical protein AHAS_Ahas09G0273500 [Arachis hypogaea]
MASSASTKVSMKLLIDTKCKRVLFAEASKEVVDFLFNLLQLPLGAVVKLLTEKSMVGGIGNLYKSVEGLGDSFLQPNLSRDVLLNPGFPSSSTAISGLLLPSSAAATGRVHGSSGFVKEVVTYMVMDDLVIQPMSTISSITLLNKFNVKEVGALQEKVVELGMNEATEGLIAVEDGVDKRLPQDCHLLPSSNILTKEAASGCLGNLYSSVENLNRVYMQPNLSKDLLLHPTIILPSSPSISGILPSAARNHSEETTPKIYKCSSGYIGCMTTVTDVYNSLCSVCYSGRTTTELKYIKGEATATARAGTAPATSGHSNNGFVKEVVTYMIMDNLVIQPMSILSGLTMLNQFNVYDVGALKEAVVQLGMNEGLKILKTSMEESDMVLTRVFLD